MAGGGAAEVMYHSPFSTRPRLSAWNVASPSLIWGWLNAVSFNAVNHKTTSG